MVYGSMDRFDTSGFFANREYPGDASDLVHTVAVQPRLNTIDGVFEDAAGGVLPDCDPVCAVRSSICSSVKLNVLMMARDVDTSVLF